MARVWPNNAANRLAVSGNPTALALGGPCTLSAWVKIASIPVAGGATFISHFDGSHGMLLRIIDSGTKNKLGLFIIENTLGQPGREAIGATVLTTGVWHHIVGTWEGSTVAASKTLGCWLDGVRDGSQASVGQINSTTSPWTFGARAAATNPLDATMCEMAFWNADLSGGTSTSPEIVALSKGVSPHMIRRGSLVGYWPTFGDYDHGIDFSGNVNDLALTGTLASANHAPVGPQIPPIMAGYR